MSPKPLCSTHYPGRCLAELAALYDPGRSPVMSVRVAYQGPRFKWHLYRSQAWEHLEALGDFDPQAIDEKLYLANGVVLYHAPSEIDFYGYELYAAVVNDLSAYQAARARSAQRFGAGAEFRIIHEALS